MEQQGLKINALEKAIGKGNGTVRKALEEETPNPKLDTIKKLAEVLGTTVSYLIGETDDPSSGKLVLQSEHHYWDYLLPLTPDECRWIATKRFVDLRIPGKHDDYETERLVNQLLEEQYEEEIKV